MRSKSSKSKELEKMTPVAHRPTVVVDPSSGFNHNARRYKCMCCSCLHITTGSIIIGVISIISSISGIVWSVDRLVVSNTTRTQIDPDTETGSLWPFYAATAVVCALDVIASITLFMALRKESYKLLVPSLLMQVVKALVVLAGVAMFVLALALPDPGFRKAVIYGLGIGNELGDESIVLVAVGLVLGLLIKLCMQIAWTTAELRCYKFFKAKKEWTDTNSFNTAQYYSMDTLPIRDRPPAYNPDFVWSTDKENVSDAFFY